MRLLAIGDIHGCSRALDLILAEMQPGVDDTLVTLGDYVDRGPDSAGVLERLIELERTTQLIHLSGNHEIMMLEARQDIAEYLWLKVGGKETLASYGRSIFGGKLSNVPDHHWEFLESCVQWHETESHFFVHANAEPHLPLAEQSPGVLFWEPFVDLGPHQSGKTMICGHTAQRSGLPLHRGHAICIDTWVYGSGWLTGLDVLGGRVWQANQQGEQRSAMLDDIAVRD